MKFARKMTVWAAVAAACLACAGLSSASWSDLWKQWSQGLGGDQDSGHRSQAVAAVRGMNDTEKAAQDTDRRNFAAIDRIDLVRIADDELDRFIREGRLAR